MGTSTKLVFASPISPVATLREFTLGSQWKTTVSIVGSDAFALALVFVFAVVWRHVLSPAYALAYGLHLMPCAMMLLVAFWAQGLYPGVLLHSAEEMRRIVFSASVVFLVVASTSFL